MSNTTQVEHNPQVASPAQNQPPSPPITIRTSISVRGLQKVDAWCGAIHHWDEFRVHNYARRCAFIAVLSRMLDCDSAHLDYLHDEICRVAAETLASACPPETLPAESGETQSADPLAAVSPEILANADTLLRAATLFDDLCGDFARLGVVGESLLAIAIYLVCVSRLLAKPLHACIQSASSSGKSYILEIVLSMMPETEVIAATDITPQALVYMPEGSLENKIVSVGERKHVTPRNAGDLANATLLLREMLSRGRIDKVVPFKGEDGEMRTQCKTQMGPIAYLETTTQEEIFDEDQTRMLVLCTTESNEQTRMINELQALEAAGGGTHESAKDAIRKKHQAAQLLLRNVEVVIPYAPYLRIPQHKLAARRAFSHLLGMIKSVAILRQLQKAPGDVIYADVFDYAVAYRVMLPILGRVFTPLTDGARSLLSLLRERVPLDRTEFTRQDCVGWTSLSKTAVANRLNALVDAGPVELVTGQRGVQIRYRLRSAGEEYSSQLAELLTPEVLAQRLQAESQQVRASSNT